MRKPIAAMGIALCLIAKGISFHANAGTWVGNGDDGSDLEGFAPLNDPKITTARDQAAALVKKLNIAGIPGLGALTPEIERSPMFMAKIDSAAKLNSDRGGSHADMAGRVFARTLAEPNAPTRFFPIAKKLDEDQLVALNIHEALHRSLPASVREDEAVVSELTLAIVSPGSSYDSVLGVASKVIPVHPATPGASSSTSVADELPPESSRIRNPSMVALEMRNYWNNPQVSTNYAVDRAHMLESMLYPFGSIKNAFGFGIAASLIQQTTSSLMGPLGLSARLRLWSGRGFDVALWGTASLNMLSAEELKNSPFGRDLLTLGIDIRKELSFFYIDNVISLSTPGTAMQKIGRVNYNYDYGAVINAAVHAGASLAFFKVGGYAEIYLADNYKVSGGAFDGFETGRYRMVSAGPEATLTVGDVALNVYGKFLVSAPSEVDFNTLGNLMGVGSGQTSVGARVSLYF